MSALDSCVFGAARSALSAKLAAKLPRTQKAFSKLVEKILNSGPVRQAAENWLEHFPQRLQKIIEAGGYVL